MREKAEANGQDLLLVDTGDRIEGNGLYDASNPKGKYTFPIFKEQHIDVICAGNHELYKQNSSENEYLVTVPDFKGNYLASNLDIVDPMTGKLVPLAPRFKKFTTKNQGLRIIAFGFIFDFYGNYNNTVVQPVENTIQEKWFQDAIRDRDVDLFLVIGHVHIRAAEFEAIFKAIRGVQWDTPIQFFGGHFHIRDYKRFDSKSYALESGRFMETIGFHSIDGFSFKGEGKSDAQRLMTFSRKYIDNNLFSFYHHTGLNLDTFPTEHGRNVSKAIKAARDELNLDTTYGCAEKDLWMSRAKYPSQDSIFTWLEERVLPDFVSDPDRANQSRIAIINTGAIRFDIFKGPFTRDSTYIVAPFNGRFRYIKDVPNDKAGQLLSILNNGGQIFADANPALQSWMLAPPEQSGYSSNLAARAPQKRGVKQQPITNSPGLIPGYTTKDDAGPDGDDTVHSAVEFYRVPNCIQSVIRFPSVAEDFEKVDVVFLEFLQPWILLAFKFLGLEYKDVDTATYMHDENLKSLLVKWVSENWKDRC